MNHDVSSNSVNTLMAFLAGAVLGGIVVALTTPKRGAEFRKDIARLGDKAKDQMGDWAESAANAMKGTTTAGMERADSTTGSLKAKAEDVANIGQNAWKEIKKGTSSAGNDFKDGLTAAAKELGT